MATSSSNSESSVPVYMNSKDFRVFPIPRRLRYDSDKPFHFGIWLNLLFGLTSTFSVANLYWCQPILIQLAGAFDVSYDEVSKLPTLVQAGYATGLLFISPLGDLVRRRQLLLTLIIVAASLTIGLAVTRSLPAFQVLTFLVGAASVTPQVLLPLAADLAPPERRATAMSIVFSGLLFGILLARVLSGLIAQFVDWRIVYYMSVGIQWFLLLINFLSVPDYPPKNSHLTYAHIMWSMAKFSVTEPVLIQACLCNMGSAAAFSSFWVTLTFLLGGDPYHYSTLVIGLFGLIGMFGVGMAPLVGRFIDFLVPWHASLVACLGLLVFQVVQIVGNGLNVAAVIIATLGLDVFRQMLETSLATSIFSIQPEARARLNAVYILSLFVGQVMGSSAGTKVFLTYGWRATAAVTLGYTVWALLVLLIRGPHCSRYTWFGYEGGWEARKGVVQSRDRDKRKTNMNVERKGDVESESKPQDSRFQAQAEDTRDVENTYHE